MATRFLWCELLPGRRHVTVTDRRAKIDWTRVSGDLYS